MKNHYPILITKPKSDKKKDEKKQSQKYSPKAIRREQLRKINEKKSG